MNLIDTYYHWKNWFDWISNVAISKMYIFRKTQKLKNITISHFVTTLHKFALKIETGWVTRMVMPILKARNVNDDAR